jgi:hypothetical protein
MKSFPIFLLLRQKLSQGCHLAFKKLNFAFLKHFYRYQMIWSFGHFGSFFGSKENCIFRPILDKFHHNILHFKNFQNFFDLFRQIVFENFIWSFFPFESWPFLKLLKAKFGHFSFLGPGKPELSKLFLIL